MTRLKMKQPRTRAVRFRSLPRAIAYVIYDHGEYGSAEDDDLLAVNACIAVGSSDDPKSFSRGMSEDIALKRLDLAMMPEVAETAPHLKTWNLVSEYAISVSGHDIDLGAKRLAKMQEEAEGMAKKKAAEEALAGTTNTKLDSKGEFEVMGHDDKPVRGNWSIEVEALSTGFGVVVWAKAADEDDVGRFLEPVTVVRSQFVRKKDGRQVAYDHAHGLRSLCIDSVAGRIAAARSMRIALGGKK